MIVQAYIARIAPRRVQRKRTKGWRTPANTVYVGRPTKWGNPYRIRANETSGAAAVERYRRYIEIRRADFHELRGKNLACFCRLDQPCHADVLLELANSPRGEGMEG